MNASTFFYMFDCAESLKTSTVYMQECTKAAELMKNHSTKADELKENRGMLRSRLLRCRLGERHLHRQPPPPPLPSSPLTDHRHHLTDTTDSVVVALVPHAD